MNANKEPIMDTKTLELEQIGSSKCWVARITGRDAKYGLARQFVNGIRDYSRANKPRTRGVYTIYSLAPGLYEIQSPRSWGKTDRYFAQIATDGELNKIPTELVQWAVA
jgi:hypothetical protein